MKSLYFTVPQVWMIVDSLKLAMDEAKDYEEKKEFLETLTCVYSQLGPVKINGKRKYDDAVKDV